MNDEDEIKKRIKELGEKSTQILTFLSFAIVVVATLAPSAGVNEKEAMQGALRFWVWAIFPVLLGIAPLKEARWNHESWYRFVRALKVLLLWAALILIFLGLVQFRGGIK